MHTLIVNYIKSIVQLLKLLVPDDDNRFVASVTQQPIQLLFNDNNQLYGFVYPIVDKRIKR